MTAIWQDDGKIRKKEISKGKNEKRVENVSIDFGGAGGVNGEEAKEVKRIWKGIGFLGARILGRKS